jgi:hypothetical protein
MLQFIFTINIWKFENNLVEIYLKVELNIKIKYKLKLRNALFFETQSTQYCYYFLYAFKIFLLPIVLFA